MVSITSKAFRLTLESYNGQEMEDAQSTKFLYNNVEVTVRNYEYRTWKQYPKVKHPARCHSKKDIFAMHFFCTSNRLLNLKKVFAKVPSVQSFPDIRGPLDCKM